MNIVHIYKDYFPVLGGIENHIKLLAEAQAAQGHNVTVLVNSLRKQLECATVNNVTLVKAPRHINVQSAPISLHFAGLVRQHTHGADVAHVHAPYPIGEACNLWFGHAKKTVLTWHSDVVRQKTLLRVYAPTLRRVVAQTDGIVVSSEAYANSSIWLRTSAPKISIVPFGIDANRFTDARTAAAHTLRQSWLTQTSLQNPLVLLGVGRLRYYKGFDDLIRAVALCKNALAVIAGIGPLMHDLQALAHELNVSDRIIFAGEPTDDELPLYHQAADVFVAPSNSRAESFGISIIEGMSSGLPAITTEIGTATSWINQHQHTGLVVPPLNPPALAQAIAHLQDADVRANFGRQARARVLQEFTQAKMIERMNAVYEQVLRAC